MSEILISKIFHYAKPRIIVFSRRKYIKGTKKMKRKSLGNLIYLKTKIAFYKL